MPQQILVFANIGIQFWDVVLIPLIEQLKPMNFRWQIWKTFEAFIGWIIQGCHVYDPKWQMSMCSSIELRLPFLDPSIVRFALNINPILKGNLSSLFHGRNGKILVRELLKKRATKDTFWAERKSGPVFNYNEPLDKMHAQCNYQHLENFLGINQKN